MNISTYGARFYGGQIDRIDKGFQELGHTINDENPDLVYANDPSHYDKAIACYNLYKNYGSNVKLILNVLDCPTFTSDWNNLSTQWAFDFSIAHKVTCISQAVKKDIKQCFNIDADVIYNPIKNVYPLYHDFRDITAHKDIFAIFVGRALAPNKRVKEIIWPLYKILKPTFGEHCIHFIGSENPGFGFYHGIVSDEKLNELYNHSIFTLISSKQEGLNLPMIEALCTNNIPIICKDMSTATELAPPELMCEPNASSMADLITSGSLSSIIRQIWDKYGKSYREKFSPIQIAKNIISVYNSINSA